MTVIHGRDVIVEKEIDSDWKTVYCATNCSVSFQNEMLGITDVNAGITKKRRVLSSDMSLSVSGVTILYDENDVLSPFYFIDELTTREEGSYRVVFTDIESGGQKGIFFTGIVESAGMDGDVNDHSKCELTILPTGGWQVDDITAPAPGTVPGLYSDWWETINGYDYISGASAVHGYTLGGAIVLEVDREGTQHDLITSGTPSGRQAKFDSTNARVYFDPTIPLNGVETVFIIFKKP